MIYLDWLISSIALIWLIVMAVVVIRKHRLLGPRWTWIPLLLAMAVRIFSGQAALVAAAVAVVLLVSERRHLKQKVMEVMVLIAGILAIGFIFFSADIPTESGIGGVLVFWIAWELHYISGAESMTLLTCVLLWPNVEFLLAYLAAGLIWAIGVRIKAGDWLKSHAMPMSAIIAFSGVIYLGYQVFLLAAKK
jgi:hypothetical protein